MGLQCSILGHAFEDAGVERERTEEGSEVVTTERELERCRRCGTERVVSESTEVAAVVDAADVDGDVETDAGEPTDEAAVDPDAASEPASGESGGGLSGAVERSGTQDVDSGPDLDPDSDADAGAADPIDAPAQGGPTAPDAAGTQVDADEAPDPTEEDAEILTDDEPDREPGQWPDDSESDSERKEEAGTAADEVGVDPDAASEPAADPEAESLSGITVPEGAIVCPECSFSVEANSGYRAGDPCPECNAWLESERNQ
jgi:hypothetical protein